MDGKNIVWYENGQKRREYEYKNGKIVGRWTEWSKGGAIIEEEMPAHTTYHLCLIEPRLRVGYQARLGIDTIVAGPSPASRLGQVQGDEPAVRLGGELPGHFGTASHIGQTTRLAG